MTMTIWKPVAGSQAADMHRYAIVFPEQGTMLRSVTWQGWTFHRPKYVWGEKDFRNSPEWEQVYP